MKKVDGYLKYYYKPIAQAYKSLGKTPSADQFKNVTTQFLFFNIKVRKLIPGKPQLNQLKTHIEDLVDSMYYRVFLKTHNGQAAK